MHGDRVRSAAVGLMLLLLAGCATVAPPPAEKRGPPREPAPAEALPEELAPAEAPPQEPSSVESIRIVAVGDIMLGTDYPKALLPPDDGRHLMADVMDYLQAGDMTFGNLEGVLLDGGEPQKVCHDPSACFLFRTPERFAKTLADAGFDVMSVANNHARDFGEAGRLASMAALDRVGILHSGREGHVASWEVQGLRVAMIAFAPNQTSHSLLDPFHGAVQVGRLDYSHDVVIVSFHGGEEGEEAVHVSPGNETYYGEDRGDPIAFAHAMIDAGADLILGHGPHVPRAMELYRNRLIAYSLGNFSTWWGIAVSGRRGLAPILDVSLAPDGRFLEGRIVSARQSRPDGTVRDPSAEAYRLIRQQTEEDFGEDQFLFRHDGSFYPTSP